MSERQAAEKLHSRIGFTCVDVKKECKNTVPSGDCKQIINTNAYQRQESTCDLEPYTFTSMDVDHSDNDCKCDQELQMLENHGCGLSIDGENEMHHQLEGEDKLSCVEISKGDSESSHHHAIAANTLTNKFEQSECLGLCVCIVGTNDSTETENNKLHSCQITFESRDCGNSKFL